MKSRTIAKAVGAVAFLILAAIPAAGGFPTTTDPSAFRAAATASPAFSLASPVLAAFSLVAKAGPELCDSPVFTTGPELCDSPVFTTGPELCDSLAASTGFRLSQPAVFSLAALGNGADLNRPSAKPASLGMPKNWRRAMLELGVISTYSTIRYWIEYHTWIEDWQFELTCEDQYRRFLTTEAIRFDSNAFSVNWTHVPGGALYYELARANGLTWAESLLAAFGGSLFYEYVSEWREVISVNDMILTTSGGYSLGEPWFQLSDYFHGQKSPVLKFLGFMNPILKFNKWLDRKNPASKVFRDPGWHDFVLSAGWRRSSEAGRDALDAGFVGFETQIIRTPEYGRAGTLRKTLRDTSLSELSFDVALHQRLPGDEHLRTGWAEEVNLFTRVVGLALFRQKIDELGRGYALSIGLGSALSYVRKRPTLYDSRSVLARLDPPPVTPTDFRDKMTVAHLVGPVIDWTRFSRGLKIRVVADAYLDFAMMSAYAFNAFSAVYPIEGLKTTLSYYGYHYALGGSVSGRVDLDWRNLSLRGLVSAHVWNSVEGLDRFQANLLDDGNVVDTRTRYLLKAGWRVPKVPLRVYFALEGIHRWGKMRDIEAGGQETRLFAGLAYLF